MIAQSIPDYGIQLVVWGATEVAVTIIAGSIPLLRVLLSDYKKSRYARSEPRYGNTSGAAGLSRISRHNGSVLATSGRAPPRPSLGSTDGDSEKNILRGHGDKEIVRTIEVTIDHGHRKDLEEGYEMNIFSSRTL